MHIESLSRDLCPQASIQLLTRHCGHRRYHAATTAQLSGKSLHNQLGDSPRAPKLPRVTSIVIGCTGSGRALVLEQLRADTHRRLCEGMLH